MDGTHGIYARSDPGAALVRMSRFVSAAELMQGRIDRAKADQVKPFVIRRDSNQLLIRRTVTQYSPLARFRALDLHPPSCRRVQ